MAGTEVAEAEEEEEEEEEVGEEEAEEEEEEEEEEDDGDDNDKEDEEEEEAPDELEEFKSCIEVRFSGAVTLVLVTAWVPLLDSDSIFAFAFMLSACGFV